MSAADTAKQETTNWGRWGDDDERGALNLLTPELLRAAAAVHPDGPGVRPGHSDPG